MKGILHSKFGIPGIKESSSMASPTAASATSLALIPTWLGIHDNPILKSHLKSDSSHTILA
jgi:hypothetical protein